MAELVSQLSRLRFQPDLRRRLARCGRTTVENRFRLTRYLDDLEHFLKEAS